MMPGLFADEKQDSKMFKKLCSDDNFKPDMLKIYPCLVTKGSELYDMWINGEYEPYSDEEAVELIAKVKDESMIDSVEESIEDRVNRQLESFNGYGVEQTALLENYELKINGKYIFYTVGENAEQVKEAYTKIIKK